MKKKIWIGLLTAAFLACAGCAGKAKDSLPEQTMFQELNTVDFEGNEVTDEIFKENDLTVINVWATWCGPCVGELPVLDELSREFEEEGKKVGIKGMIAEVGKNGIVPGLSEEERKNAEEVISATGITFQQLLISEKLSETSLKDLAGFPTTYFVDKEGNLVGNPITGSEDKEGWLARIEERLEMTENEK